jgi:hypothetical protein
MRSLVVGNGNRSSARVASGRWLAQGAAVRQSKRLTASYGFDMAMIEVGYRYGDIPDYPQLPHLRTHRERFTVDSPPGQSLSWSHAY